MRRINESLERELLAAGAESEQAQDLAELAAQVSRLKGAEPRARLAAAGRFWPLWRRCWRPVGLAAGSLALGMALVAVAQTSYPGGLLYPLKRLSEVAVVGLHPDYRGVLMMRRAQEVKQLVAVHASPALVKVTLDDYMVQATGYAGKNYAAFAYCKSNLVQAETLADGSERQEITAALDRFKDID